MPESIQTNDQAESLFADVERMCRPGEAIGPPWQDILSLLVEYQIVESVAAWAIEFDRAELLGKSIDWPTETLDITFGQASPSQTCIVEKASLTAQIVLCAKHAGEANSETREHQRALLRGITELLGIAWVRTRYDAMTITEDTEQLSRQFVNLLTGNHSTIGSLQSLASLVLQATMADRVSLLQIHAGTITLHCMAPAGSIQQRSPLVTAIKAVTREQCLAGQSLAYSQADASANELAPTVVELIEQSHCRQIVLEIDVDRAKQQGVAIVIERFESSPQSLWLESKTAKQSLPVLKELARRRSRGLWGRWPWMQASPGTHRRLVWIVAGICVLIAVGSLPTDFQLPVEGQLHPVASRGVFATNEGFVEQIHVAHGEAVKAGAMLLTLRDPKLEREQSELEGRIAALQSQIASAQVARSTRSRDRDRNDESRLSANEQDLVIQLAGLQREHDVITEQLARLVVVSPIDGVVHRWDLDQALPARPVNHGQYLLDIIDPQSAWELRLDIADDLISYVIAAHDDAPCAVAYRIRSSPESTYHTTLKQVANSAQIDDRGRNVVQAVANVRNQDITDRRIGAGVVAQIDCGRRSIAFVWLRELIELWQRSFLT